MRVDEAFPAEEEENVRPSKRQRLESGSYGNYSRYYQRRAHLTRKDARLELLPDAWFQGKRVLDIGCNAGKVTIEIAHRLAAYRVVGVDIDGDLIREANKQVRLEWSMSQPMPSVQAAADALVRRKSDKISGNGHAAVDRGVRFFPMSMPRMFGFLPYPPSELLSTYEELDEEEQKARAKPGGRGKAMPREIRAFPENIKFKTADWLNEDIEDDRRGYDVILAFSVIKWIALNEGDKGVTDFFSKIFECLRPNGRFVLEPQPWESYVKARRSSKSLQETYATLKIRPEDYTRILLEDIGFIKVEQLGIAEQGFPRPMLAFTKGGGSYI